MGKKSLSPGFRFHPTDVELVKYYLKRKVLGKKFHFEAIAEVDIYKYAPWELPDRSCLRTGDLKWYFFCPREKKYSSGTRMNRATDMGFWKITGKDRVVQYNSQVVGMIKTLVFHRGKAPKGDRTDWVMYEYRLQEEELSVRGVAQDAYVLCSIFKKDGPGPRNGAQYGAPFKEEDWDGDDDDDVEVVNGIVAVSCAGLSAPIPINERNSIVTSLLTPSEALPSTSYPVVMATDNHVASSEPPKNDDMVELLANFSEDSSFMLFENDMNCELTSQKSSMGTSILCPSEALPSASNPGAVADNNLHSSEAFEDDYVLALLANFSEDNPFKHSENDMNEVHNPNHGLMVDHGNPGGNNEDGFDIYNDLGDLGNLGGCIEVANMHNFNYMVEEMGNGQYMELMDFSYPLDVPLNCHTDASGNEQVLAGKEKSSFVNDNEAATLNADDSFCQTFETGSKQASESVRRGRFHHSS